MEIPVTESEEADSTNENDYAGISSPTRYLVAAFFFLVIPAVAFVLLGGVQKLKRALGVGSGKGGKYTRLQDLEK